MDVLFPNSSAGSGILIALMFVLAIYIILFKTSLKPRLDSDFGQAERIWRRAVKKFRVYALLGDGEIQEGQVWEAFMFASQYKLDNLCVMIDNNGLQIDGKVENVMSPYPIADKLTAFGFRVETIDGHDFDQIESALGNARITKKPLQLPSDKGMKIAAVCSL